MAECYLTTVDNKIDPSVDFDEWYVTDTQVLGYDTCAKLARVCVKNGWTDELSDEKKDAIVEDSIDEIVDNDFLGIFKKICKKKNDI